MNPKCKTCEHMIFDERFGEYKCDVYKIRCYAEVPKIVECKEYKEKK